MARNRSSLGSKDRDVRSSARSVQGARRVSEVKVTKADGTVEIRPAYKHAEARRIVDGDKPTSPAPGSPNQ